jgi:uncharacterized protein YciI
MKKLVLLLALSFTALAVRAAETPAAPATPPPAKAPALQSFLIVLRPVARLHDDKAWTAADNAAVGAHFQRLKAATEARQVILAGRTHESGDKTMGLVIFTATDETAAREFMNADPCVVAGVMTATLHPYDIALLRKN